jgi:hypothetical protein
MSAQVEVIAINPQGPGPPRAQFPTSAQEDDSTLLTPEFRGHAPPLKRHGPPAEPEACSNISITDEVSGRGK